MEYPFGKHLSNMASSQLLIMLLLHVSADKGGEAEATTTEVLNRMGKCAVAGKVLQYF